jgi:hypothetical protein
MPWCVEPVVVGSRSASNEARVAIADAVAATPSTHHAPTGLPPIHPRNVDLDGGKHRGGKPEEV